MQVQHARCAGLDVHKKTVVACILITAPDGQVQRHLDTFSTMTSGSWRWTIGSPSMR